MIAAPADAAANWPCPVARTFGKTNGGNCRGPECPVWRWQPLLAADPSNVKAIKAVMQEKDMRHKEAVKYVNENRADLGLPTEPYQGWCGLGGKPE